MTDDVDRLRILNDDWILIRRLNSETGDQPATYRRVIGLDPRVDDDDADPAPITPTEREVAIDHPEWTKARECCAAFANEWLAPGRQV